MADRNPVPYVFKELSEDRISKLPFPFDQIVARQKTKLYGKIHLIFEKGVCVRVIVEESIVPTVED